MTIIFYDADNDSLYICNQNEKMKVISLSDQDLSLHIPDEDILWVGDAACITKPQFVKWLKGEISFDGSSNSKQSSVSRFTGFLNKSHMQGSQIGSDFVKSASKLSSRLYIHPKHNGSIVIPSIKTKKFPDGLELDGKYHFEPLDELPPNLEENSLFKSLLKKGKIEIVTHEYVVQNIHKKKGMSPSDMATDSILIKDGNAKDIASVGGIGNYDDESFGGDDGPIPIIIK